MGPLHGARPRKTIANLPVHVLKGRFVQLSSEALPGRVFVRRPAEHQRYFSTSLAASKRIDPMQTGGAPLRPRMPGEKPQQEPISRGSEEDPHIHTAPRAWETDGNQENGVQKPSLPEVSCSVTYQGTRVQELPVYLRTFPHGLQPSQIPNLRLYLPRYPTAICSLSLSSHFGSQAIPLLDSHAIRMR